MILETMLRPTMAGLRLIDPETAHSAALAGSAWMPAATMPGGDPRLCTSVAGIAFAHPIGLAAGFDKDAKAAHGMARFGFAAVEVGTLTPRPQAGNPRPRLFRLVEDAAVINRMGFNNGGQQAALPRLRRMAALPHRPRFGVNIGANKDSADRIADYVAGWRTVAPFADWITANISSPNTPGLRALQDEGALDALLGALAAERQPGNPPLFLKIAPDLDHAQIDGVVKAAMAHGVAAIIMGNTTISRPPLRSIHAGESGGLSGAPLAPLALARLRDLRAATGGAIPLIAAGGIASADDVWARLAAGASLVQLYSALVYEGPWLAARLRDGLLARMASEGMTSLGDLIDLDARKGH